MKIGVVSDIHGNIEALKAVFEVFESEKCDRVISLGDVVNIGPYSKECLEFLKSKKNVICLQGNHEEYCLKITTLPLWISTGEKKHSEWSSKEIGGELLEWISQWKCEYTMILGKTKLYFCHYAFEKDERKIIEGKKFKPFIRENFESELDKYFQEIDTDIIFYGHEHQGGEICSKKRYVNVGSSGCTESDVTHGTIISLVEDGIEITKVEKIYNRSKIISAFEKKDVPEKEFILKVFYKS